MSNKETTTVEEPKVVTEELTPVEEPKEKKPRKPREKVRDVEEIIDLPLTKLTEKEKDKLITYLKETVTLASNKVDAYKQNAETSMKQAQNMNDQYNAMEAFYRKQFRYINTQLEAFETAITQVTKGGLQ